MSADAPVETVPAVIEAEDDEYNDVESVLGGATASSTVSIGTSILNYRTENGRTYHSYKEGRYLAPNDDAENDRLDLQHHIFSLTFNNKLLIAPIPKEKPLHRVLDVGTGTGIWAIDFADEHPESQVIGVDLSPIQPLFVPPNACFEVDDIEASWTWKTPFDLIHCRMMTGSVKNWPRLIEQSFENLTPGGWLQLADGVFPIRSDDGTMTESSAVLKWARLFTEALSLAGQRIDSALQYKEQLEAAGFVDVEEVVYKWPSNQWPKDRKLKEIGAWQYESWVTGVDAISIAAFTRILGWTPTELEVLLAAVRKEFKDTKIHSYFPIYVVYGRKPESKAPEAATAA